MKLKSNQPKASAEQVVKDRLESRVKAPAKPVYVVFQKAGDHPRK